MAVITISTPPDTLTRIVMTPRVLIIEDNALIRNLYYKSLLSAGFAVMPASNGLQAKELLTNFKPDIILLDLELPDLDCAALLTSIALQPISDAPTVVGFSARDREQTQIGGLPAHFLYKPVSLTMLMEMVRQISVERTTRS
jgi:DNA-binding response OmpR family regulator